MLEALILTLREGVEAALVVGIIVAFLRKEGEDRFLGAVWGGLATAVAASFAGAFLLYRAAINQEAFEGVLYVASAVVVASFVVWMWRHAQAMGGKMRGTLGRILAGRNAGWIAAGLFAFTFFMVVREGIETVLFLSAVSLSTSGIGAVVGAVVGIASGDRLRRPLRARQRAHRPRPLLPHHRHRAADLRRPAAVQRLPRALRGRVGAGEPDDDGDHRASGAPRVLLLRRRPGAAAADADRAVEPRTGARAGGGGCRRPPRPRRRPAPAPRAARRRHPRHRHPGASHRRLHLLAARRHPLARRAGDAPPPTAPFTCRSTASRSASCARFAVDVDGEPVRFIVLRLAPGDGPDAVVAAFDACVICGDKGYVQDDAGVTCLLCHSVINPRSIGQEGGCNPIPLDFSIAGGELRVPMSAFTALAPGDVPPPPRELTPPPCSSAC